MDIETRVARLEATEQIRALKARYAAVCDNGYDPDAMVPLFTRDAVWDGGERFGVHDGIDAIYAFFEGVSGDITWALHYMIAPSVEVADDLRTARASWYLLEPCTLDGQALWLMGTYRDEYRREDDGWRFSRVEVRFQTMTPHDEGWARRPFAGE